CLKIVANDYWDAQRKADVARGAILFDPTNAESCLAFIAAPSCSWVTDYRVVGHAACLGVFTGTVAVGSACGPANDCIDGGRCDLGGCDALYTCCTGTCTALGPVGASCMHRSDCEVGLYCAGADAGQMISGACQKKVPLGSACGDILACEDGATCDLINMVCV